MQEVVKILTKRHQTIATMESCTGGGIVNAITNVEGASAVLKMSAVTYSNEYKIKMGVNPKTIEKYTVYSTQTAMEMSRNISEFSNANYGIGITGKLNKPDPNNQTKNDSIVYISIYDRDYNQYYNDVLNVSKNTRNIIKQEIIEYVENRLLIILNDLQTN